MELKKVMWREEIKLREHEVNLSGGTICLHIVMRCE